MSLWSRITNVFRADRPNREIDEELRCHLEEAIEQGRDPDEARRAFGSPLRHGEASRDVRMVVWLDSLRADIVFGWRQLKKRKIASAAAILSLGLGIGASMAAFRLIDALFLRPLPVAGPERLFALLSHTDNLNSYPYENDSWTSEAVRQFRAAVQDQAETLELSRVDQTELTFGSYQDAEDPFVQFVSGRMFGSFGLQPALGRLLTESDDLISSRRYAVLSYDYWTRRFGRDPAVIGRTFRLSGKFYEIAGVGPEGFTGIEAGILTDVFLPASMVPYAEKPNVYWALTWVHLKPEASPKVVADKLRSAFQSIHHELRGETLVMEPAGAGVSGMRENYRRPLTALGILLGLVLLIACANVANLMLAQAMARDREMALRVSIGAGRARLVQLAMVESILLACFAAALGGLFTWWATPWTVEMLQPARFLLPLDWRVSAFGLALTFIVTMLFGLAPALRVSEAQPAGAQKGGAEPRFGRRWMHATIALEACLCCFVLFHAGLFVTTLDRLLKKPTGFSADRLLILNTVSERPEPAALWDQVAEHLRSAPGVDLVALASWPLLQRSYWTPGISVHDGPPIERAAFALPVSPAWAAAMKISFLEGRDFLPSETYPGAAIVNSAFSKRFFNGENPVGQWFETVDGEGTRMRCRVVGVVGNAGYRNIREPFLPTLYVPLHSLDEKGALRTRNHAAIFVRTRRPDPTGLATMLTGEIRRAAPDFRVSSVTTQQEVNNLQTIRERLLAMLARFFAGVALLLAGIGLYGVLNYTVIQRGREIGVRMALGAQASHVVRSVTVDAFAKLIVGAAAGLGIGVMSARYIASLLYRVKATDAEILALPLIVVFAAAVLAALPAAIRAVRIDPAAMLRND